MSQKTGSEASQNAPAYLTVEQVASYFQVSKMTIYRLIHGGKLKAIKVGQSFRVPRPALEAFVAEQTADWPAELIVQEFPEPKPS